VDRVSVYVHAEDPISRAGVVSQLRQRPELALLGEQERDAAAVVFVAADTVDESTATVLRALRRKSEARLVLIAARIDDAGLGTVIDCGVAGVVHRFEASGDRLVEAARATVRGEGCMPSDLVARLMTQMGKMQKQLADPRGLSYSGMNEREIEVLKLVAEGLDTREIAGKLAYSERTVKNILHDVTTRLQLRNRAHAVAYALRQGLI
jgi:DNA-binding NarL/FixJ family response regulator